MLSLSNLNTSPYREHNGSTSRNLAVRPVVAHVPLREESSGGQFRLSAGLRKVLEDNSWRSIVFVYDMSLLRKGNQYIDLVPIWTPGFLPWPDSRPDKKTHTAGLSQNVSTSQSHSNHILRIGDLNWSCSNHLTKNNHPILAPDISQTSPDLTKVPLEIWEVIIENLSKDDVKNLRLTSTAIEKSVSASLFKTVVVPFSANLLTEAHSSTNKQAVPTSSWLAKGRGVQVFNGFGPHIQHFGMTFEVSENSLRNPPIKAIQQGHKSYWGTYKWPFPQYSRFKDRADLELAADDTASMKRAFLCLKRVYHLALSVDSGLGWLNGPDKALQSQILPEPERIFASSFCTDVDTAARRSLWSLIRHVYSNSKDPEILEALEFAHTEEQESQDLLKVIRNKPAIRVSRERLLEPFLESVAAPKSLSEDEAVEETESTNLEKLLIEVPAINQHLEPELMDMLESTRRGNATESTNKHPHLHLSEDKSTDLHEFASLNSQERESCQLGLLYVRPIDASSSIIEGKTALIPRKLTKTQKEWLLESAWAQDAFLSSYILSIVDNSSTFRNVTQLTISRLSSRHLAKLQREEFWQSLQALSRVTLQVLADWRDVRKSDCGSAVIQPIGLGNAVRSFYTILQQCIAQRSSITCLKIGWVNGGEHAQGIFARNCQVLPAPLMAPEFVFDDKDPPAGALLCLPYVKGLTITNCWIAPGVAERFFGAETTPRLASLCLESISLTADMKMEIQLQINGQYVQGPAQIGQNNPWMGVQLQVARNRFGLSPYVAYLLWNTQDAQEVFKAVLQAHGGTMLSRPPQQQHVQPQPQPQQQPPPPPLPPPPRPGSWPDLLERLVASRKSLQCPDLSLKCYSCGYVRLLNTHLPQRSIFEGELEFLLTNASLLMQVEGFIRERRIQLSEIMMRDQDHLHGEIAAALSDREMQKLDATWGFYAGWPNSDTRNGHHDQDEAIKWGSASEEAAKSEGGRPAGTGRFSGSAPKFLHCSR